MATQFFRTTPDAEAPIKQVPVQISPAGQKVLEYIESTFDHIIQEIQVRPHGTPVIILSRITAIKPYYDQHDYMRLKWHVQDRQITYSFPGKTKEDAWKFACIGRILGEIHHAIKNDIIVTKRDIYYHDPALFGRQTLVDRFVDDIAHTCGVTRRDLNVTASPKGLVAGLTAETITIPHIDHNDGPYSLQNIKWVLVVEKEASFNSLVERNIHQHPTLGSGIILTAKGYPDVSTRQFLRFVYDRLPSHVPLLGLFDLDPDGIRILKCYMYGSKTLAQEHACNLPEMRWIGLKSADLVLASDAPNLSLHLSARDRSVALSMLSSDEWRDEAGDILPGLKECYVELQRMLLLNKKAEIQILEELAGGAEKWLTERLSVRAAVGAA